MRAPGFLRRLLMKQVRATHLQVLWAVCSWTSSFFIEEWSQIYNNNKKMHRCGTNVSQHGRQEPYSCILRVFKVIFIQCNTISKRADAWRSGFAPAAVPPASWAWWTGTGCSLTAQRLIKKPAQPVMVWTELILARTTLCKVAVFISKNTRDDGID